MINIYTTIDIENTTFKQFTNPTSVAQETFDRRLIMMYVEYLKGTEDKLSIELSAIEARLPGKPFRVSQQGIPVKPLDLSFETSGNYRIPIPTALSEEFILVEPILVGQASGTVNIWLVLDDKDM